MRIVFVLIMASLSSFIAKGQKNNFNFISNWKKVDSLMLSQNKPKSALTFVNTILQKAKLESNFNEQAKAYLYKIEIEERYLENIENLIKIEALEKEITLIKEPVLKSLMQLYALRMYTSYYQNNQWNFPELSTNEKIKSLNLLTKKEFQLLVNEKAKRIVQPSEALWTTNLSNYQSIVIVNREKQLRNTMYELLSYEIIEQLQIINTNDENNLAELNDNDSLFTILPQFLKTNIEPNNSNKTTLWLIQNMLNQHVKTSNNQKIIDADLFRITFATAYNSKYSEQQLKAINYLITTYTNDPQIAWAIIEKASILKDQGMSFGTDKTNRWKKKEAVDLINNFTSTKNNIDPICLSNLNNIKRKIEAKSLGAKLESVNIPALPFRMLLNFKNTNSVHYKIIKLKHQITSEEDEQINFDINNEKDWSKLIAKNSVRESSIQIPLVEDYQEHSTEVKIDSLPVGKYALIAASSNQFSFYKDAFFYVPFAISNLAVIQNNYDVFVVDRNSGQPIKNAQVKVYTSKYNPKLSKYENSLMQSLVSNENGYCKIDYKNKQQHNYYTLHIQHKNDELLNNSDYVRVSYNSKENNVELTNKEFAKVHFFTDRSIYRPHQKVYFKGIVLTKNNSKEAFRLYPQIKTVSVELLDANYVLIDTLTATVNEFGSINGTFNLPKQLLTGNCTIRTKLIDGYTHFRVEEYKRPTFNVAFVNENKAYDLNKLVTLKGNAKAFAGNNIDNAKLSYVVTRKEERKFDWRFFRLPYAPSNPVQIANGNGVTKEDGSFEINFTALPDSKIDKKDNPIFVYTVEVSVTDIKGETRDASYDIKVGYSNTIINLDIPEKMDISSLQTFNVSTTSLQNKMLKKEVTVQWQPLNFEKRLIRQRLWEMPDTFLMDKSTYTNLFPNDEYNNETNPSSWDALAPVATQTLQTTEDAEKNKFNLPSNITSNHIFKVTASVKDENGDTITTEKVVEITANNIPIIPTYASLKNNKENFLVNDTVSSSVYSSVNKLFVIKNTTIPNNKQDETAEKNEYDFIKNPTNGNYNLLSEKSFETDTNFAVFYAFVQHNRFFTDGQQFNITKPINKLDITYNSFRNKTLPGSEETYSLTIKGEKGEAESAELLSSMYDASLDEFYTHEWDKPNVNKELSIINNQFAGKNIGNYVDALQKYNNQYYPISQKNYNKLLSSIYEGEVQEYNLVRSKKYQAVSKMSDNKETNIVLSSFGNYEASKGYIKGNDLHYKPEKSTIEKSEEENKDNLSINKNEAPSSTPTIRKNFNETAFFLPNIYANNSGVYSFTVTLPEALTTWKWQNFAHTKKLTLCLSTQTIITQKTVMVQPNVPRFLTQGDVIELATTIANTSEKELTGSCTLQLFNAITNSPIDGWFNNIFPSQYFTVKENGSIVVKFPIQVPQNFTDAVTYKIIAQTNANGNEIAWSDGEENTIPVLSNKLYLTNSLPLYLKPNELEKSINYPFLQEALEQQNNIQTQAVTVEYTPNTIFTIVKALPYLMEYPFECAEQTFNRFFAYAIASQIVSKNKDVQLALNNWKNIDSANLNSNLENNQELKQIVLNETPWVQDATNQTKQLKHIANLLGDTQIKEKLGGTLQKLQELQLSNGGFSWFKGGRENTYITQYILTGLGKLLKYNFIEEPELSTIKNIINNALPLLDKAMQKQYLLYLKETKSQKIATPPLDIQYWYMRSLFVNEAPKTFPTSYFKVSFNEFAKKWQSFGVQQQAMLSVAFNNFNFSTAKNKNIAKTIAESLIENAIEDTTHDLLYFKTIPYNCYWYDNNFETQTITIEALEQFSTFKTQTQKFKNWFLLNKQTNNWESTVATASACMALLNKQNNAIELQQVNISIGNKNMSTINKDYGTAKETFKAKDLLELNGNIKIATTSKSSNQPSYGAVYVQYFQPIEDVQQSTHPYLTITKKVFIKKTNNNQTTLVEVKNDELVHVGDELVIQLHINSQKNIEYVHVKDNRAAGTEPKNVLSEYKWQQGIGYYEATKDASTNFFIDNLTKGIYTLQYNLSVTHTGSFNTGIASIQCLYAPSFVAHSNGSVLKVE